MINTSFKTLRQWGCNQLQMVQIDRIGFHENSSNAVLKAWVKSLTNMKLTHYFGLFFCPISKKVISWTTSTLLLVGKRSCNGHIFSCRISSRCAAYSCRVQRSLNCLFPEEGLDQQHHRKSEFNTKTSFLLDNKSFQNYICSSKL